MRTTIPTKGTALAAAALLACAGAFLALHGGSASHGHQAHASMSALDRTVIRVAHGEPLGLAGLAATDGKPFDAQRLRGRWSIVFFGFTSCPHVCPTTLHTLARLAGDPESGVASGATQVLFVSIDTERDTPQRVATYLESFDRRFVGVTGDRDAVARFGAAVGAGFAALGADFDHSTSLFVLDPEGRLAGVLLNPSDPERIRADIASLRG